MIAVPEMEPWMPESTGVVAAFHPAVFEAVASPARPPVAPSDAVHGLHQGDKASLAGGGGESAVQAAVGSEPLTSRRLVVLPQSIARTS